MSRELTAGVCPLQALAPSRDKSSVFHPAAAAPAISVSGLSPIMRWRFGSLTPDSSMA